MENSKTLNYTTIGSVVYTKNRRARNISIRIREGKEVRVTLPWYATYRQAEQVVMQKQEWIVERLSEFKASQTLTDAALQAQFRYHTLLVEPVECDKITIRIKDGKLIIQHPVELSPQSEPVQEAIKNGIRETWRAEALLYLPQRIAWLAHSYGFMYQNVRVRDARTRWASCTGEKNISLSLYIMRLPSHLIDYVLLHELCHTVVPNHGKDFYALMDKVTKGRNSEFQNEMRNYKPWI